jgi:hypothetical protein
MSSKSYEHNAKRKKEKEEVFYEVKVSLPKLFALGVLNG